MKKTFLLTLAISALAFAACDKTSVTPGQGEGSMQIRFNLPEATRASFQGHEADINNVQMLIFDEDGNLCKYHNLSSSEIGSKSATMDNIAAGDYSVYIVANGPALDDLTSEAELDDVQMDLAGYNDPDGGFVMEGHSDGISVSAGHTATPSISLSRYVARITVKSITNELAPAYCSYMSNLLRNPFITITFAILA